MTSSINGLQGSIPKLIWQTYKQLPPANSKPLVDSWIKLNPDYQWMYMDDPRAARFIRENFSQDFADMYDSLPIGVMKADVWRVAVVYAYGGVYTDLDCRCIKPISTWLSPTDTLVVGVEVTNGALLNYTFAAVPRHPALLSVLNQFMETYNSDQFMNRNSETPVQNFGQYGFSNGVLRYYGINSAEDMIKGGHTNFYNEVDAVKKDNTKFILRQDEIFSVHHAANTCVVHEVASIYWNSARYTSWRKEQKRIMDTR